jgi:hypothetical protein
LLAALLVSACDDDPGGVSIPPRPDVPTRIQIAWENPRPQGNDLRRMWGFSDGSFVAVGDGGTVLERVDGTWTSHDTPARSDLHGIWADRRDNIYVAGFDGTIIHFNGDTWRRVSCPTTTDFYAVWGKGNDLFVAGLEGRVWRSHSGAWTEYVVSPGTRFRALWGYATSDVYVAGSGAKLFHFDGSAWTQITIAVNPQATVEIRDLWGPAPGSLSFVAGSGLVWFQGSTWTSFSVAAYNVYGLWGFTLEDQVAISAGTSSHWVGGNFSWFATPTEEPLFDIWGRTPDDCVAVGRFGNVAHFDGTGWQPLNTGSQSDIRDVHVGTTDILAVGEHGAILRRAGDAWIDDSTVDPGYELSGAWMSDQGTRVAVGRYAPDGVQWRQAVLMGASGAMSDVGPVGDAPQYLDVWGSANDDIYVAGWGGEIVHFDGAGWSEIMPDSGDTAAFRCITGTGPDNILCVGRSNDLTGLAARFVGFNWEVTRIPMTEVLYGAWVESPTSAFAVGAIGALLRFNGTEWKAMKSPTAETLLCVAGKSSTDVYAAGWRGTIVHYDGTRWVEFLPATGRNLHAVSLLPSGDVLLGGDVGALVTFRPPQP